MASYSFECRRDGGGGGALFVPTALSQDSTRHIIPGRDQPPLCGAETQQPEAQCAPAYWQPDKLCPRCRQRHARKALEREGVSTGWEGRDAD